MKENQIIGKEVSIGKGTKIWNWVNIYGKVSIGKNCMVGCFVEIQDDTEVGDNTKIQSHSFIPSKTRIGNNVFVSHHFCGINDTFYNGEVNYDKENWGEIIIEDDVIIGSSVTMMPVKIGKGSIIGCGSVVTRDIPPNSLAYGNPCVVVKKLPVKYIPNENSTIVI